MTIEVVMPAMEMDQTSARLVRWLKSEGDLVAKGDPLMEIETDKVTVEIEAPGSGVLSDVRADAGAEVPVGQIVALLVAGDGVRPAAKAAKASPLVRRKAAEHGVDLATIPGSGPGGAVTAADLEAAVSDGGGSGGPEYETRPLTGAGRIAAERLSASYRDAPHFSVSLSVEASALLAALQQTGESMTVTAAIAALAVRTLADHPALNAHFVNGELRLFRPVHLGVAVALEDGLIVPVIRDANRKSPDRLQRELADIVRNARNHTLGPSALGGSTFTVSNLGMFGIDRFTAILNPPEVGILTVGRSRELPTVVEGEVVARPIIDLTLCADHRAVDGAKAASFLAGLAGLIREPVLLTHRETDRPSVASS